MGLGGGQGGRSEIKGEERVYMARDEARQVRRGQTARSYRPFLKKKKSFNELLSFYCHFTKLMMILSLIIFSTL